jgi:hypothetical protein
VVAGRIPAGAPSTATCVALWNEPQNAVVREQVSERGYPGAHIDGVYSDERYEGCVAWFFGAIGEPWATYDATRIPGRARPLRWTLLERGKRWSHDSPEPTAARELNAAVHEDGSISLRDQDGPSGLPMLATCDMLRTCRR